MGIIYIWARISRGLSREEEITNIFWASVINLICMMNHTTPVLKDFELLCNRSLSDSLLNPQNTTVKRKNIEAWHTHIVRMQPE